jgi:predicted ATPase with chaperone activity
MTRISAPLHRQIEPELQLIDVWSAMAIPSFRVVGLPGQEIIESCERVRAAIEPARGRQAHRAQQ